MIKFLIFMFAFSTGLDGNLPKGAAKQEEADNCEHSSLKLDKVRNDFAANKDSQKLILIARLGAKEKSSYLNKRRLYAIKKYLGIPENRIITAQGDKTKGLANIEIYINGELNEVLRAKNFRDIPMGRCGEDDKADRERYQLPK